ncbi:hypothetical protein Godav_000418 [Gossypium davidsonii]|uniref:non-specific serine/threonine protein kinase n=2 Tax=Gossypium TaxID=3633 RepID=A0A7J8SZN1_GOSDV|nr:hypothetical protein [Gossypium davidsonii]MBA0667257.1 hypothetical protein [Gossypium klotzschianum]
MEKYELVKDIGSGNFGVARLMRNKETKELVAMKYIDRGHKIDENVAREIINHRSLRHPNIIRFKEQICHRDLKLENTLLDGSPAPRLKICDFGYSKSSLLHSRPKSTVGTPAYIAPEVLSRREYDGKVVPLYDEVFILTTMKEIASEIFGKEYRFLRICFLFQMADVWSCGVTLYVMLVGAYPFEDQEDPKNFRKTISRIMSVQYKIPDYVHISQDCRHLLSRIFVASPSRRISIKDIKSHPWFLKNLPRELTEAAQAAYYRKENPTFSLQSVDEIMKIVEEAKVAPPVLRSIGGFGWGGEEDGDAREEDTEQEEEEEEDEYEKTVKEDLVSNKQTVNYGLGAKMFVQSFYDCLGCVAIESRKLELLGFEALPNWDQLHNCGLLMSRL